MPRPRKGPTFIQRSRQTSSSQKAAYHNDEGAGRSHVIRKFFDLSDEDERLIVAQLERGIDDILRRTG